MKKHIIAFIFSLIAILPLCSQTTHYRVTLWIHQIEDSTIYIHSSYGEKERFLLDSLQIQRDGSFILEGDFRQGIVVVSNKYQKYFSFIFPTQIIFRALNSFFLSRRTLGQDGEAGEQKQLLLPHRS
jgi:hypothetical protein